MNSETEQRLRRYRPVCPSPTLRARILAAPAPPASSPRTPLLSARRTWPWAVAAAAALTAIGVVHAASGRLTARAGMSPVQDDARVRAVASATADALERSAGSDQASASATRRFAALLIVIDEQNQALRQGQHTRGKER